MAGDFLVAAVTYGNSAVQLPIQIPVSDTYGNAFVTLDDVWDLPATQGLRTFYAPNVFGGPNDVFQATFAPVIPTAGPTTSPSTWPSTRGWIR